MKGSESTAEIILQRNPELFERYLLIALNSNSRIWHEASRHLCIDRRSGHERFINDFDSTLHYILYRAIVFNRQRMSEGGGRFRAVPDMEMLNALLVLSQDPVHPVIAPEKIAEVHAAWLDIRKSVDKDLAVSTVTAVWKTWLTNKKAKQHLKTVVVLDGEGFEDAVSAMKQVSAEINSTEDDVISFEDVLNLEEVEIERMPLSDNPFKKLNEVLGGGFGRTEHTLFVAPSGAGKTVIACQLATDLTLSGYTVLLITTEQSPQELMPRMLSCASYYPGTTREQRIPFAKVKDCLNKNALQDVLTRSQWEFAVNFFKTIGPRMQFSHWTTSKSVAAIQDRLDIINRNLEESNKKKIDVVILDWIGKALAEDTTDQGKLRLLYQSAATAMKDLAVNNNIATISLAQAKADAVGKAHIDNSCIAECHSLHNEATVAIGISAMKAKDTTDSGGSSDSYAENQCFYCFKARKSSAQQFMMRRNFAFQRFDKPSHQ